MINFQIKFRRKESLESPVSISKSISKAEEITKLKQEILTVAEIELKFDRKWNRFLKASDWNTVDLVSEERRKLSKERIDLEFKLKKLIHGMTRDEIEKLPRNIKDTLERWKE